MKLLNAYLIIFFSLIFKIAFSQGNVEMALNHAAKKQFLKQFSTEAEIRFNLNMKEALRLAPEKGWAIFEVADDWQIISLQGIDEGGFPIYYTTHNVNAAATIGTNNLWPGGSSGLNLSSSSDFLTGKLGLWDGGRVRTTHQEFSGRIAVVDNASSISSHATHVAGTLIAAGINPLSKGMSFGLQELKTWDYNSDVSEMANAATSLLVSNHSYGAIAGWRYNSARAGTATDPNWEWYGDPAVSTYEDYKFGYYNSKAKDWDLISYNAPYYQIVKSAGNNRNDNGPAIGSPYWTRTAGGQWQLVNARVQGAISDNNAYDIISAYANAKNVLLIGAVNAIPEGYTTPSDVVISSFSCWGPTDDGRIKPDVVANGVSLYSTASTGDAAYRSASGTSMAAPNASGSIFLLQELYHQKHGDFMLSSTLRGIVCQTAHEAGNIGPDYIFGWGLINMEGAAKLISNSDNTQYIEEIPLYSGDTIKREIVAVGTDPLVVTIAWTDPAGTPLAYGPEMLNNRTPLLVNDLDLRITYDSTTYLPWVLDAENPSEPATKGDNNVDIIEQVVIENPIPGRTYSVTISHKGTLFDSVQVVSIIASGVGGTPVCPSFPTNESGTRIDGFQLNSIDNLTDTECHTYRDFTNHTTLVNLGSTYPFKLKVGTCDQENSRIVKIFADWNSNGIFDENELIITSDVINSTSDFEGMITIPTSVKPGFKGRLRIIVSETTNPDEISSCGIYNAGETQDYLLKFDYPLFDIGVSKLKYPSKEIMCSSDNEWVKMEVKNYGSTPLSGINFTAEVYENFNLIETYHKTHLGIITPSQSKIIQFDAGFKTSPSKNYSIICIVNVENDLNPSNDTLQFNFITAPLSEAPQGSAILCDGTDEIKLEAVSSGTAFWYDAPINGHLLAAGESAATNFILPDNKYYVGINTLSDSIGSFSKDSEPWTNGSYHQAAVTPYITTYVPVVLKSAIIYAGWPGTITLRVEDVNSNEVVSQSILNIEATRNPPSPTVGAGNDLTDNGKEYLLNLEIPEPGNYRISISYADGVTIYRNNGSASNPYPFAIPDVISITGSNASVPGSFYYWLYNIKIESYGCKSDLSEVLLEQFESPNVQITSIINPDSTVILNAGNPGKIFLWNTGETTQTILVNQSGTYSVTVTNEYGCSSIDSIQVNILGVVINDYFSVKIFPNPAENYIIIESLTDILVEIYNYNGIKKYRSNSSSLRHNIDLFSMPASVYLLKIIDPKNEKYTLKKIIIK